MIFKSTMNVFREYCTIRIMVLSILNVKHMKVFLWKAGICESLAQQIFTFYNILYVSMYIFVFVVCFLLHFIDSIWHIATGIYNNLLIWSIDKWLYYWSCCSSVDQSVKILCGAVFLWCGRWAWSIWITKGCVCVCACVCVCVCVCVFVCVCVCLCVCDYCSDIMIHRHGLK